MGTALKELHRAVRSASRNTGFAVVVVAILALGTGATTTIFNLLYTVVLAPLPYKDPDRLVVLGATNLAQGVEHGRVSMGDFVDWREESRSYAAMGAAGYGSLILKTEAGPEEIPTAVVSANLFHVLGVHPLLGRTFLAEEERPGHDQVVVLSHSLWRNRFGADPHVVGRRLDLSGYPYVVVGVMPPEMDFPSPEIGFWSPMALDLQNLVRKRRGMNVIARLRPSVSPQAAQGEMDLLARRLEQRHPDTNTGWGVRVVPLHEKLVGEVRPFLLVLMTATGLVMLIGCSNVAHLLLTRAAVLRQEVAVRAALGASRAHLLWHHIAYSSILSLAGGVVGIALSHWAIQALVAFNPLDVSRITQAGLNQITVGFALGLSLVTGLVLGGLTGLQSLRSSTLDVLKASRSGSGRGLGRNRAGEFLVVAEISLALLLLIAAGLLIKSFSRLIRVDPGFDPKGVLVLNVFLPPNRYPEPHQQQRFQEQFLAGLRNLPGIESAAASSAVPMNTLALKLELPFLLEGRPGDAQDEHRAAVRLISPGYFKTLRISLRTGRDLTDRDRDESPPVAIVNNSFRHRFLAGGHALGERLTLDFQGKEPYEIVGVVDDIQYQGLDREPSPEIYIPALQHPSGNFSIVLRAVAVEPQSLLSSVRGLLQSLDSEQAFSANRLEDLVAGSVRDVRFTTLLLIAFASLALLLTVVGIYGLTSYVVSRRTPEIGVRMALGARPADILYAVVGRGLALTAVGTALGIAGALASTALLESLLYGVSSTDPFIFLAAAAVLVSVSLLGSYLPARRAARLDPSLALRSE
jgi:putative ABC transport system permease protein